MDDNKIRSRTPIEIYKLNNIMMRDIQNHILNHYKESGIVDENFSCVNGWILRFLYNNRDRDVFQRDVEQEFRFTRSTASKIIRLMEKKGLIRSERVPEDARLKRLHNTDAAKDFRYVMREVMEYEDSRMYKGFSDEEIVQLESYIKRMIANLDD